LRKEQTEQEERERVSKIKQKYAKIRFESIPDITPALPFHKNSNGTSAVNQLTDSTKTAMEEILLQADPMLDFETGNWVPGWQRYIQRAIKKAITKNTPQSTNLNSIITGFFQQVDQRLKDGDSGFEAFSHLIQLMTLQFGEEDRGDSFTRLHSFRVPNGTTFAKFLQAYRAEVANVAHFASVIKPDVSWILEVTRNKINDQFPSHQRGRGSVCFGVFWAFFECNIRTPLARSFLPVGFVYQQ